MSRIDRSRIVGKSDEELDEFSCGICHELFVNPVVVSCCRQTFCKECIGDWLIGHKTCPNDRKLLTRHRLSEAPRCVTNFIARMQIKCRLSDRGCPSVHSVDHDSTHMTVCQFVACRRCGLNDPGPSHDCVIHLMQKNVNLTEDINELRTENENLKTSNNDLMSSAKVLKEEIKRFKTELDSKADQLKSLKTSNIDLMSSEIASKEENKKLKTELDLKRDELKTLNEKVIQLERESLNKTMKDCLNKNNCRTIDVLKKQIEDLKNYLESSEYEKLITDLDKCKIDVTSPGKFYVIKSFIRLDQTVKDIGKKRYQDSSVRIVAPIWVKQGLEELAKHLPPKNTVIEVNDYCGEKVVQPMSDELSLRVLQQMARNDAYNTDGRCDPSNYGPGIDRSVVLAIKDLSRQCVVVGSDWTTNICGYVSTSYVSRIPQKTKVFICDLSGLQFQTIDNSGRLVMIGQPYVKGLLDDFIYEHVVKQPKPSYAVASNDSTGRFIPFKDYFFDSQAYIRFVANDVLTCGLALDLCTDEEINFKFLKYGTDRSAGQFQELIEKFIGEGVAQGLEQLLPRTKKIKAIDLSFYESNQRLINVWRKYGLLCQFSEVDPLMQTHPRYMTATTNCSDPNACAGNTMGYDSIDSAIAENLSGKAIKFSPHINLNMSEVFLDGL